MSYSQFETLEQTLDAFDLTPIEAQFFPDLSPMSNGLLWRFLRLEGHCVTIDLTDYLLTPVGELLAKLA